MMMLFYVSAIIMNHLLTIYKWHLKKKTKNRPSMVKTTIPIREFCDPYRSSVFEDGKKPLITNVQNPGHEKNMSMVNIWLIYC